MLLLDSALVGFFLHVTCSGEKGNKLPATSDRCQIQYKPTVCAIMASDNQLDKCFLSRTCYWKKLLVYKTTHPFCIRQSKLAYHSEFGQSNAAMCTLSQHTLLVYTKSVRCRSLLRQTRSHTFVSAILRNMTTGGPWGPEIVLHCRPFFFF